MEHLIKKHRKSDILNRSIMKSIEQITIEVSEIIDNHVADEETRGEWMDKLYGYLWTERIYEFICGRFYRWMYNGRLTTGGILVDVRFTDKGVHLLFKIGTRFQQIAFDSAVFFQKMTHDDTIAGLL
jgi:hypothetical protein